MFALSQYSQLLSYRKVSLDWWLLNSVADLQFTANRYHVQDDPLIDSTVLMLHGNGVDGSTNISDSTGRHFVTPNGSAQIDTAQSKFGGASILTAGGADCLSLDGSSDFVFSTGDFTIDFWLRPSALSGYLFLYSGCGYFDGTGNGIDLFIDDTTDKIIFRRFPTDTAQITSTTALSINTLYHVALTRASGQTRLFINGTQEGGTFTDSTNYIVGVGNVLNRPVIGKAGYGEDFPFSGWIDEFRILKGVAAWTANFTPPTRPYEVGIGPYDQLSITRASIGYAQTVAGTLTQFAANQLRITDKGLLIEDARTNSLPASQNFSNGTYWAGATRATDNFAVAPDGTTTAAKLIDETPSNITHRQYNGISGVAGAATWSIYFKAGNNNFAFLCADNVARDKFTIVINLTTGAVTDSNTLGPFPTPTYGVDTLGNGWFRAWISVGSGGAAYLQYGISDAGTVSNWGAENMPVYTGSGLTIVMWGAQVEAGAFASSYIPTVAAAATRAAETILVINAFDTIMNGSEGSVFANAQKNSDAAADASRILGNNTGGNRAALYAPFTNNQVGIFNPDFAATINAVGTIGSSLTWQTGAKGATSWGAAGASAVGGGGTVGTDVDGPYPFANTRVGAGNAGTAFWNGYIRRLTAWNSRLADATLQNYTNPAFTGELDNNSIDLNFEDGLYTINSPLPLLSITRASIGYAQTVAGTLTQFAANQLRITDQGLLIEDARTNVWRESGTLSNNQAFQITMTGNQIAAPDGTVTATKMVEDSNAGRHLGGYKDPTIGNLVNAVTYTISVYLKNGTRRYIGLDYHTNTVNASAVLDTQTGTITSTNGTLYVSSSVESLANGWFRLVVVLTADGSGTGILETFGSDAAVPSYSFGAASYTGDGSSYYYAWGAQCEVGAFASSYIPTTSAAATRASDAITSLNALQGLIVGAPATFSIMMDVKRNASNFDNQPNFLGDSGVPDQPLFPNDDSVRRVGSYNGSVTLLATLGNSLKFIDGVKVALGQDGTGRSLVGGGGTVTSDANTSTITSAVGIGSYSGSRVMDGYMRRLTAWDTRLADATLQGFTNP